MLSLQLQRDAYTLDVKIDSTTVSFLLDCGFNGHVKLDRVTADAVHLHGYPYRKAVGIGAQAGAVVDSANLSRMHLGTKDFTDLSVIIAERHDNLLDRLLGAQFLQDHAAILDYEHNALYVQTAEDKTFQSDVLRRTGDIAIPMIRLTTHVGNRLRVAYVVQAFADFQAVELIVDSGAQTTLGIDLHRAAELHLPVDSSGTSVTGAAGNTDIFPGRITHFALDAMHVDSLEFSAIDLSAIRKREREDGIERPIDGIIGFDLLESYSAIIDFGHDTLYLHPPAHQ